MKRICHICEIKHWPPAPRSYLQIKYWLNQSNNWFWRTRRFHLNTCFHLFDLLDYPQLFRSWQRKMPNSRKQSLTFAINTWHKRWIHAIIVPHTCISNEYRLYSALRIQLKASKHTINHPLTQLMINKIIEHCILLNLINTPPVNISNESRIRSIESEIRIGIHSAQLIISFIPALNQT